MARPSIDNIRALPDYAQVTRWNLQFVSLPVIGGLSLALGNDLNLRCESTELPKSTNQPITVVHKGHEVDVPGRTTYSKQINLTFQETVDNKVSNFARIWRDAIWGPRSGITLPKSQVTGVMRLERLNQQDEPIYQYLMYGVWIKDFTPPTLDSQTNDIFKLQIVFAFDYFTEAPLKV